MKRIVRNLLEAIYFLLCFAPIPLLAGYLLLSDGFFLLLVTVCEVPVAFLISLLPGRIGGKKKTQEVFMERSSSGGDPDPDRNLRRDTHEDEKKSVSFPLRAVVCGILTLASAVILFVGPVRPMAEDILRAVVASLVPAAMLPVALIFCASGKSGDSRNVFAGVILYVVSGIAAVFIKSDSLNLFLSLAGAGFMVSSLWLLNDRAMHVGAASRSGVKPPAAMRRSNRFLLIGVVALSALVAGFGWLKEKTVWLVKMIAQGIWKAIMFLSSLVGSDAAQQGGGQGGEMDMSALMGDAQEPSKFWEIMTYFAYVLTAVILIVLLFFVIKKLSKAIKKAVKGIAAWFSRFAGRMSEDYSDEQESLLDWGEVQKEMGETLKKRLGAIFQRDKKWEAMDGREKARHLVRVLYRRARVKADSRTLREAAADLRATDPALIEAYELARYADREPDTALLEKLRKDERV